MKRTIIAGLLFFASHGQSFSVQTGAGGDNTGPCYIQVYMPDRSLPKRPIAFTLIAPDGHVVSGETDFTGRAVIPIEPGKRCDYMVLIESDRQSYSATEVHVSYEGTFPIYLNPMSRKPAVISGPRSICVSGLTKPPVAARSARVTGLRALASGNRKEAVVQLERAITLFPEYVDALNDLGMVFILSGDLDRSRQTLTRSLELCPESEGARINLAVLWTKEHRYEEAITALRQLNRENPSSYRVLVPLADALAAQGNVEEAGTCLLQALKSEALTPALKGQIQYRYGQTLAMRKQYAQALDALSTAARLLPRDHQVHFELGAAAFRADQFALAEKELKTAYRLGGDAVAASQLLLGRIYLQRGQTELARAALRKFLSESPSAPEAAEIKALLQILK